MEWKELQVDNLPPDILTGDYMFEWKWDNNTWHEANCTGYGAVKAVVQKDGVRYRKPEPKPPTHEEIMTKWWRTRSSPSNTWEKVTSYSLGDSNGNFLYFIFDSWRNLDYFTIRQSADIPPE